MAGRKQKPKDKKDIILCGVVVEKVGELERFCTNEALYAYPIMAEDGITPTDGVALCQEHSDKFDDGKSILAASRHGERYLLQLIPEAKDTTMKVYSNSSPPAAVPDIPSPN